MPSWESIFSFALLDRLITVTGHLAWPVTVLVALILFRTPISNLISRIKTASLWGASLTLDEKSKLLALKSKGREAEEGGPKVNLADTDEGQKLNYTLSTLGFRSLSSSFDPNYYLDMAQIDCKLSMAAVRIDLEAMIENLYTYYALTDGVRYKPLSSKARELLAKGYLTPSQFDIYQEIVPILNKAVHGAEVSYDTAKNVISTFTTLLDDFAFWLKQSAGLTTAAPSEQQPVT